MRTKTFCLIALLAIVAACTENSLDDIKVSKTENNSESTLRTMQDIVRIANNAPKIFGTSSITRTDGNVGKTADLSNIHVVCGNQSSTRSCTGSDTLLYVVNYSNNQGYVLIPARNTDTEIIGYIEEGCYDENTSYLDNGNIDYAIELACNYLMRTQSMLPITPGHRRDTIVTEVGPLLTTKWGQCQPEGTFCPNGLAGCGNTALAQIMSYYEYPDTIELTYEGADVQFLPLNWTEIKKHRIRHSINNQPSLSLCLAGSNTHQNLGKLCRQLGELEGSIYSNDGTTCSESGLSNAAHDLGYTTSLWRSYNKNNLINILNNNRPVIMSGESANGGHIWVLDGIKELHISGFNRENPIASENSTDDDVVEFFDYFEHYNHINWGWDGMSNGYFLCGIFDSADGYEYDPCRFGQHDERSYNNILYFELYR